MFSYDTSTTLDRICALVNKLYYICGIGVCTLMLFVIGVLQLRVSSIMSNSPYILVLDCDMYCNDSISAREAMCFYVDPRTPSSLGWVQYPQKFHNISETDIYDGQLRTFWTVS